MSHYTKRFTGPGAEADALAEIESWLGADRKVELEGMLKRDTQHRDNSNTFAFVCSFAGIQGYPVRVWYKHIYGVDMPPLDD